MGEPHLLFFSGAAAHASPPQMLPILLIWGALHLYFTSKVNELHQMTESFQCFQVNRKSVSFSLLCFLCEEPECISPPHLSLSNIWLLVRPFLCLSWADSKNYITSLLTVYVCVFIQKAVNTRRPCSYLKRRWPNVLPLTAVLNRQSGFNHLC